MWGAAHAFIVKAVSGTVVDDRGGLCTWDVLIENRGQRSSPSRDQERGLICLAGLNHIYRDPPLSVRGCGSPSEGRGGREAPSACCLLVRVMWLHPLLVLSPIGGIAARWMLFPRDRFMSNVGTEGIYNRSNPNMVKFMLNTYFHTIVLWWDCTALF